MPFLSKDQSKACWASHGFNGKVNCGEWAKKTNYKNLPKKKFKEWLEEVHPELQSENINKSCNSANSQKMTIK